MNSKTFGSRQEITVFVRENEQILDKRQSKVEINWAAYGSVSIVNADAFRMAMVDALEYAKSEAMRLGCTWVS